MSGDRVARGSVANDSVKGEPAHGAEGRTGDSPDAPLSPAQGVGGERRGIWGAARVIYTSVTPPGRTEADFLHALLSPRAPAGPCFAPWATHHAEVGHTLPCSLCPAVPFLGCPPRHSHLKGQHVAFTGQVMSPLL